ncbi:hypothetical protein ANRL3_00767 [Anaerolineae bacterium]|nr:hypothetical protein ANRL3_00767 [Anaerolineae bacterium]
MSRNTKIILWIVLPLLASCILLCIAAIVLVPRAMQNAVSMDPAKAKEVAAQIADYTLPRGYSEQIGMDFFTMQMVALGRNDRRGGTIMLMQFKTAGMSREQMEQQMRQSFQNQYQGGGTMKYVGERTVTIKGQPTVDWDWRILEDFLGSIR